MFNVLDYSAVSFPTGMVADKNLDTEDPSYESLSEDCKSIHLTCKSPVKT